MIVILQGRLSSTRLPGKGLFTFHGSYIWSRMCALASSIPGVEKVYFSTGPKSENPLLDKILPSDIHIFYGSEENVLSRFYEIAHTLPDSTAIVRITCDNYLVQPLVLQEMVHLYTQGYDYCYIRNLSHFAGEIFSVSALKKLYSSQYTSLSAEHVTYDLRHSPYFLQNLRTLILPPDFMNLNHAIPITLDTLSDLILMKKIEYTYPSTANYNCLATVRQIVNIL